MSGDVNFQGTNEEWTEFVKRINKEKKRLITEIMEDDAKDGLYHIGDTNKMVTAVEWLFTQLYEKFEMKGDGREMDKILEQAKELHREQVIYAFENGEENVEADTYKNGAKQYYEETYRGQDQGQNVLDKPAPKVYYAGWVGLFQNRTDI